MQVADEAPERHMVSNGLYRERGFCWIWHIVEHLQNTGHPEDEHEEDGGPACAEGISPACLCGWNGWGVKVVEEGRAHGENGNW